VDGRVRKPSFILAAGAVVELAPPPPAPSHIPPQAIALDVLYEDDAIIVVNKPPGLVVHPGAGNPDRTLVNALVHHSPGIEGVGGVRRPGVVHRLDKDTSGAIVAAKTDAAFAALVSAMQRREIVRQYLAIVWWRLPVSGRIDAPIGRDRVHRKRMRVLEAGGRDAATIYRTVRWFDFLSLVELTLLTGRTHQIRVHLSHVGNPVFGDSAYGGRARQLRRLSGSEQRIARGLLAGIGRQALHACRLALRHPTSGQALDIAAPMPPDFAGVLSSLAFGAEPVDTMEGVDEGRARR
jgi:23S rRNA pseudouridine1911/1915/1917 synthase